MTSIHPFPLLGIVPKLYILYDKSCLITNNGCENDYNLMVILKILKYLLSCVIYISIPRSMELVLINQIACLHLGHCKCSPYTAIEI